MTSIAVIIANAHYTKQDDLECCIADQQAISALLEATGRFTRIVAVVDVDGDGMRDTVRRCIDDAADIEELLFYFSGHGAQIGSEFYFCGTTFDGSRPNETGLSHTELHVLLRAAGPKLLVKIIDACASGTLLVKGPSVFSQPKEGFRNFVQLASCLNDQSSFGGEPLSQFTQALCEACIRKEEGPIYYADIINTLRDDFLENEEQTPFFVSQGTARELLIEDAKRLSSFRERYLTDWAVTDDEGVDENALEGGDLVVAPSAVDLLRAAEATMAGPSEAKQLIDELFDAVEDGSTFAQLTDFYDVSVASHSDFIESTTREFIIRVLAKEPRPDRFVTAESKLIRSGGNLASTSMQIAMGLQRLTPDSHTEYNLELNVRLERVQIRVTLDPKFKALQRLVVILSCAPSLERCYVFEVGTFRVRNDWNGFEDTGKEFSKRWWRLKWDESTSGVSSQVLEALEAAARSQIDGFVSRLQNKA